MERRTPRSRGVLGLLALMWGSVGVSSCGVLKKDAPHDVRGRVVPEGVSQGALLDRKGTDPKATSNAVASAAECRAQLKAHYVSFLYPKVLQGACAGCHVTGGLAGPSGVHFAPDPSEAAFDAILAASREPSASPPGAAKGTAPRALLIAKPLGVVAHGGGAILASGSPGEAALQSFADAAKDAAKCATLSESALGMGAASSGTSLPLSPAELGLPQRFPLATLPPVRVQLLERGQIRRLAERAFSLSLPEADALSATPNAHGLPNDRAVNRVEGVQALSAYLSLANVAAERVDTSKVLPCTQAELSAKRTCQKTELATLLQFLFRAPQTTSTIDAWWATYLSQETAVGEVMAKRRLVQKALFSPLFLYRMETGDTSVPTHPRPLTGEEIASRLALALTGNAPDDGLRAKAKDGSLLRPETVALEARRLLMTPEGKARFVEFVFAWLGLSDVRFADKRVALGESFPDSLATSLRREVEEFILRHVFERGAKLPDLLLAESTWVDEQAASIYGATNIKGTSFQELSLKGTGRRGLITLPLVLAASSKEAGRSPMQRGEFITRRLLCRRFPTDSGTAVMALPEEPGLTLRERFRIIESTPNCKACHALLSAGFALEGFDPLGRAWPSGVVNAEELKGTYAPIGAPEVTFDGAHALVTRLAGGSPSGVAGSETGVHPDLANCFVSQLGRFLAGRDLAATDEPLMDSLVEASLADGIDIPSAVGRITSSPLFMTTQKP